MRSATFLFTSFASLFALAVACSPSSEADEGARADPTPTVDASVAEDATSPAVDASAVSVPHLHAHNDYEHARPLLDALDQGFDSVEADIHQADGKLEVSHDLVTTKGTLAALYLEPLAARITANGGSVHGDGRPFFLWLDLKEDTVELKAALVAELAKYDFLSTFTDAAEETKAVTVILTGSAAKVALADTPAPRRFIRDSNDFDDGDPQADTRWGYYALLYLNSVSWDGQGTIPAEELTRLKTRVDAIHQKGRKLRFYASPDMPAFYDVARATGVDFIGTDDLAGLAAAMKK